MRTFLLIWTAGVASVIAEPSAQRLQKLTELHRPLVRYVAGTRYDLTPLVNWLALDYSVQAVTPRPLPRWEVIHLSREVIATNGWVFFRREGTFRADDLRHVAVRNLPPDTEFRLGVNVLAYQLGSVASQRVGTGVFSGIGYDFGITNPPPKVVYSKTSQAAEAEKLMASAERGEPSAQFALAMRYLTGRGVETNQTLAVQWFRAAMTNGHAQASNELARIEGNSR